MENSNKFVIVYENFTTGERYKLNWHKENPVYDSLEEAVKIGKISVNKQIQNKEVKEDQHYRIFVAEEIPSKNEMKTSKLEQRIELYRTHTCFRIAHDNGWISGFADKNSYDSFEEAKTSAVKFKEDPRAKTPSMSDSNVEYWKSQKYTITKEVLVTTELEII